ncbi:MAG: hypothetical protein R2856_39615 [Caldilineaceae bacterium]
MAILILVSAPTMWLKLVLLLGLVGLNVWAIRNLQPSVAAHALTPQTLHLRYGDNLSLETAAVSLAAALAGAGIGGWAGYLQRSLRRRP